MGRAVPDGDKSWTGGLEAGRDSWAKSRPGKSTAQFNELTLAMGENEREMLTKWQLDAVAWSSVAVVWKAVQISSVGKGRLAQVIVLIISRNG